MVKACLILPSQISRNKNEAFYASIFMTKKYGVFERSEKTARRSRAGMWDYFSLIPSYSHLKASTGSFLDAERAGINPPIKVSTTLSNIKNPAILGSNAALRGMSPIK